MDVVDVVEDEDVVEVEEEVEDAEEDAEDVRPRARSFFFFCVCDQRHIQHINYIFFM